jgi:prepilin-type N-terminal cleavage/methylation domain-containing protein
MAGFSLIELMITVAVMGILTVAGVAAASAWRHGSMQMQSRDVIREAVSQARAVALRNPGAQPVTAASTQLALDGAMVEVWKSRLTSGVEVKAVGGGALVCMAFDNRGRHLPAATGCATASRIARLTVDYRSEETLYVDVL